MAITYCCFLALFLLSASACTTVPTSLNKLNPEQRQAIVVKTKGIHANLSLWEKEDVWRQVYHTRAVIGRNGIAGLNEKREGDGKTPQGIFDLKRSFGYAPTLNTGLAYAPVGPEDLWVDDPESVDYNQWVKQTTASSFEQLRREDDLYSMATVIEYNTAPIEKGKGSAIFMHIWRHYYTPTAGCVALSSRDVRRIMARLNAQYHPVMIIEEK